MFKNIQTISNGGAMNEKAVSAAKKSAITMHDKWREGFVKEFGLVPRIKTLKDGTLVDINTRGINLPEEWLQSNHDMAYFVALLLYIYKDISIENAAAVIHMKWLHMNEWAKGGALDVPYEMLPEKEKKKDREVYEIVLSNL